MSITLTKNLNVGFAKLTSFNFSVSTMPILVSNQHITWILDDGSVVENARSIKHVYQNAGIYNPMVLVYTLSGVLSATNTITVDDKVKETIYISSVPPPTYAGFLNSKPFRVKITSKTTTGHRINLYAKNSRSDNYQSPQNKWSFSKPQWRFLDLSGNQVDYIETIDKEIKIGTKVVGISGYADFYFVDDIYNEDLVVDGMPYSTIVATLDASSLEINNIPVYANSKIVAEVPHMFLYKKPDYLKITENGINPFTKNKWSFAKHPFVISPAYKNATKQVSSFCHYIPFEIGSVSINTNVVGVSAFDAEKVSKFEYLDINGHKIGGFYKDFFTVDQLSAENCRMVASVTITTPLLSSIPVSTFTISGSSTPFNLFSEPKHNVFKLNENFDMADHIKSISFMPALNDSDVLFDDFLGGIFGKFPFEKNDVGVSLYEKTANFVSNHSDIDKCDVFSLYDLAAMVDLDSDNFLLNYPDSIRKIMDIASVNQSRLWGTKCHCGMNFTKINDCNPQKLCSYCGEEKPNNRGKLLANNAIVPAASPLVLKVRSLDTYRYIPAADLNSLMTYSLSSLASAINLPDNWRDYYEFYEYVDAKNDSYIESLIDWKNPQTTLMHEMSSFDSWMGQNGVVENLLSFELFKGLELENDGL